jgi:hypothetical protein
MITIGDVLVPQLFEALQLRFGDVHVTKAGEPVVWGGRTYVDGRLRQQVLQWGETYRVNCIFCSDTRHQLSVPHFFGQPDVDNENRPMTWMAKCFNENCLRDWQKRREFSELVLGPRNWRLAPGWRVNAPSKIASCLQQPFAPGRCIKVTELPSNHDALRFLIGERQFSREVLDYYGVGYCVESNPRFAAAQDRIIIPVWFRGEYAGWQARFAGEPTMSWMPKYYTMDGMAKSRLLYNFDRAVHKPFVVVVRGVTDVWRIGDWAVATFGTTLTPDQHALIEEHWRGKPVILLCNLLAALEREPPSPTVWRYGNHPAVVRVHLPNGYRPANYDTTVIQNFISAQAAQAGVHLA